MFELPGDWGVEPLPHLADPLPLIKIRPREEGRVSTPHLSFAEVGMLFYAHKFHLMQFLKYLQRDDLNFTAILIHTEE